MEVVLLERVQHLGFIGDVVTVKNGFARNFLIPKGKALRATTENLAIFEKKRALIEADNLKKKEEADVIATKISGLRVRIIRQAGESGRLFGSVRNIDIAKAVCAAGFTVNKSQVSISIPIKMLGVYQVKLMLHSDVFVEVKLHVAQSEEEVDAQIAEETGVVGNIPEEADAANPRETAKNSDKGRRSSRKGASSAADNGHERPKRTTWQERKEERPRDTSINS
ncbi:MAG: 50S ribosomal protein L9 [Holosporales bacterium]|jgi:large subunit ribosomal protein L9|nr:50S ribosomal protein L9 [Holosporales bacterium]